MGVFVDDVLEVFILHIFRYRLDGLLIFLFVDVVLDDHFVIILQSSEQKALLQPPMGLQNLVGGLVIEVVLELLQKIFEPFSIFVVLSRVRSGIEI